MSAADYARSFAISKIAVFSLAKASFALAAISSSFALALEYCFAYPTVNPFPLEYLFFLSLSWH